VEAGAITTNGTWAKDDPALGLKPAVISKESNAKDYFISCEKGNRTRTVLLQYRCSLRGF